MVLLPDERNVTLIIIFSGLCGFNEIRDIEQRMQEGDQQAKQAIEAFVYRVRKYLGAYLLQLGGHVDAVSRGFFPSSFSS
jgi:acetate kinase